MICKHCGSELQPGSVFCPHCGGLAGAPALDSDSLVKPESPKPSKKKPLLIGGIAAVVVAGALLVAAVSGLFSSGKRQVERAVHQSLSAYVQAWEAMGIPDLEALRQSRSIRQRMSLQLTGFDTAMLLGVDLSPLSGLGLRMDAGLDGDARRLDFELAAFWDDQDVLSLQAAAADDELYFASPQLTEGSFYGVNTETLGADLTALGAENAEEISFNVFDMIDAAYDAIDRQEEAKQALQEAWGNLFSAAQVRGLGTESLDVNGVSQKTAAFQLTIPQDALEDCADALVQAIEAADYMTLYREMLQAGGMSQLAIDQAIGLLEEELDYSSLAESLRDFAGELGDITLELFLYDGYVAAVRWSDTVRGSDLSLLLTLGGGERYVDDLGLTLEVNGVKLSVRSTGDHGGKEGAFTDSTTFQTGLVRLNSQFRYDPQTAGNNLSWSLSSAAYGGLTVEGRLDATERSIDANLDHISIDVYGIQLVTMALDYYAGPWDGQSVTVTAPQLITRLSTQELQDLGLSLQDNAQSWLAETQRLFLQRLPAELIGRLLY